MLYIVVCAKYFPCFWRQKNLLCLCFNTKFVVLSFKILVIMKSSLPARTFVSSY